MKEDEKNLLVTIARREGLVPLAREIAIGMGIPEKRQSYIFNKWSDKGWYEYGVSEFFGWLTDKGKAEAQKLKDVEAVS